MGWGLAGAVGLQADKMRWVPGQKQARYDIAGFITLLAVSSLSIPLNASPALQSAVFRD